MEAPYLLDYGSPAFQRGYPSIPFTMLDTHSWFWGCSQEGTKGKVPAQMWVAFSFCVAVNFLPNLGGAFFLGSRLTLIVSFTPFTCKVRRNSFSEIFKSDMPTRRAQLDLSLIRDARVCFEGLQLYKQAREPRYNFERIAYADGLPAHVWCHKGYAVSGAKLRVAITSNTIWEGGMS